MNLYTLEMIHLFFPCFRLLTTHYRLVAKGQIN
jgi:hypothetical protein